MTHSPRRNDQRIERRLAAGARAGLAVLAALAMSACAAHTEHSVHAEGYPEAAPFEASSNARTQLESAISLAHLNNDTVVAVFGANWCHDSRALAGWLQTPRFTALLDGDFQVVYIDAGVPQTGEGRNLDLAAEYGVSDITGTPTVLFLNGGGELLNTPDNARSWRNTASRSEEEIFAELESHLPTRP